MAEQFDRVAIAIDPDGVEYIVLEPQLVIDYGQGQGPQGGVITIKDGWIAALGSGEARLAAGQGSPGGDIPPTLLLRDHQGKHTVQVAAYDDPSEHSESAIYLHGAPASLHMRDAAGNENTLLNEGNLWLGGKTADGDIMLFANNEGNNRNVTNATIHLNGDNGRIRSRSLIVQDESGRTGVSLDGHLADIRLGGDGKHGSFYLYRATGDRSKDIQACVRINQDAVVKIGGNQVAGQIYLFSSDTDDTRMEGQATIHLNGLSGDITLSGSDCAERFTVADEASSAPGAVLVVKDGENLVTCTEPYDRRVAGVVSGAGQYRPGIILGSNAQLGAVPVALVGKAYCKVDTSYGPIECGDLLTTSQTPGHAMRASDRERAFGSVLGKALASFSGGTGLIPILVTLQ